MNIEIQVTTSTVKHVRCNVVIDDQICGNLEIERANFTRVCDRLFGDGYSINMSPVKANSNVTSQ